VRNCSTKNSNIAVFEAISLVLNRSQIIKKISITKSKLIIYSAVFFILFSNMAFYSNTLIFYRINLDNVVFLMSLVLVSSSLIVLTLSLVCFKYTIKPILILTLVLSSLASYFMDNYNIIIDETMIQSFFSTDSAESMDLFTIDMLLYISLLGILPSVVVYKINIEYQRFGKEIVNTLKLLGLSLTTILLIIVLMGDYYATFFREHAILRSYTNPTTFIYSSAKYFSQFFTVNDIPFKTIGLDAKVVTYENKRKLVIFVVGETARSDKFSLNGYQRDTNSLLQKENVISLSNFWSCATSTAISVPCMFSIYNEQNYNEQKVQATENVLDVLQHAGVNVLWLDNNSDSKGVALRVPYKSFKTADVNPICDSECRDEGMLVNLDEYINNIDSGDIFIVLHQQGNHGPAYYKRYPAEFEKYKPACNTNQLENCSLQEIKNAYDNAISYTDYFLSKVINLLKNNSSIFNSSMFYVSDHGESLGENGLYLHGMPRLFAPDSQRHVAAIMWFSNNAYDLNCSLLDENKNIKFSHDNIFHTILGLMEVKTVVYKKEMDVVSVMNKSYRIN